MGKIKQMRRYLIESINRIFLKGYGFFSDAKKIEKT